MTLEECVAAAFGPMSFRSADGLTIIDRNTKER